MVAIRLAHLGKVGGAGGAVAMVIVMAVALRASSGWFAWSLGYSIKRFG